MSDINPLVDRGITRLFTLDQSMQTDSSPSRQRWSARVNLDKLPDFIEEMNRTKLLVIRVEMNVGGKPFLTGVNGIDEVVATFGLTARLTVELMPYGKQGMATLHGGCRVSLTNALVNVTYRSSSGDEADTRFVCASAEISPVGLITMREC